MAMCGFPPGLPPGSHDELFLIVEKTDYSDGSGARLVLQAQENLGDKYFMLIADHIAQQIVFLPEGQKKSFAVNYDQNLSTHTISIVPLGDLN